MAISRPYSEVVNSPKMWSIVSVGILVLSLVSSVQGKSVVIWTLSILKVGRKPLSECQDKSKFI